jgi:hypothetical protein
MDKHSNSFKGKNRRDFLKNSALIGAVVTLNPFKFSLFNDSKTDTWPAIRERITPIAIVQDAANLLIRVAGLSHVVTEARKSMEDYAEILQNENSSAWNKYVVRNNFFTSEDQLLQLVNDFSQREIDLDSGLLEREVKSLYTKAVSIGIQAVKLLDAYFKDNISDQQFMKRLNIG